MCRFIFLRSFLRSIGQKPGRFLVLLAIVALGAGFYAGLRMTAPDMDRALDAYLDGTYASDIRVVSTLGLTDEDLDALRAVQGVRSLTGAQSVDAQVDLNEATYTIRFHSLPSGAADSTYDGASTVISEQEDYLNRIVLDAGRWPSEVGECVICADCVMDDPYGIGDVITLKQKLDTSSEDDDSDLPLISESYTVVGLVRSPLYVSQVSLGSTTVGSGSLDQYAYVLPADFAQTDYYSEAYLAVEGSREVQNDSDAYWALVQDVMKRIEELAPQREQARLDGLKEEACQSVRNELEERGLPPVLVDAYLENSNLVDEALAQVPDSCEWLILDRDKSAGAQSFMSDADRVDHIAQVFPLVFFLVAALVALTTMTRMVDEDRILIGTFKALGYSRTRITMRYVGYGLLASGIGALIGIVILSYVLPSVIMNAYGIMYWVPPAPFAIDLNIALLSWAIAVGVIFLATWFSIAKTLHERPAALLLPPAPKGGKRILLERVGLLWKHLSFSWKVTLRNLFRYKKRAIMTLIGIAGCTALLLTGLGLHNAINDIIDIHFTDILHYNAVVTLDEDELEKRTSQPVEDFLDAQEYVQSYNKLAYTTYIVQAPDKSDQRAALVVPENQSMFSTAMTLRSRETHQDLPLEDGKALINEKLAHDMGIAVGDMLVFAEQDSMGNATNKIYKIEVAGLFEAYVNNSIIITPKTYEDLLQVAPVYSTYYLQVSGGEDDRSALTHDLEQVDMVNTVSFTDETIDTYRTMLRSVDLIVVVLVISAALLAFIVLYNITNINIEERVREIATLKVLGFTHRETNAYIFREVIILALVGSLIGLVVGIPLESFVVTTAEVDMVMFGRTIHEASFVIAFVATLLFAGISLLLMLPKIARINMVTSLKSNE